MRRLYIWKYLSCLELHPQPLIYQSRQRQASCYVPSGFLAARYILTDQYSGTLLSKYVLGYQQALTHRVGPAFNKYPVKNSGLCCPKKEEKRAIAVQVQNGAAPSSPLSYTGKGQVNVHYFYNTLLLCTTTIYYTTTTAATFIRYYHYYALLFLLLLLLTRATVWMHSGAPHSKNLYRTRKRTLKKTKVYPMPDPMT